MNAPNTKLSGEQQGVKVACKCINVILHDCVVYLVGFAINSLIALDIEFVNVLILESFAIDVHVDYNVCFDFIVFCE